MQLPGELTESNTQCLVNSELSRAQLPPTGRSIDAASSWAHEIPSTRFNSHHTLNQSETANPQHAQTKPSQTIQLTNQSFSSAISPPKLSESSPNGISRNNGHGSNNTSHPAIKGWASLGLQLADTVVNDTKGDLTSLKDPEVRQQTIKDAYKVAVGEIGDRLTAGNFGSQMVNAAELADNALSGNWGAAVDSTLDIGANALGSRVGVAVDVHLFEAEKISGTNSEATRRGINVNPLSIVQMGVHYQELNEGKSLPGDTHVTTFKTGIAKIGILSGDVSAGPGTKHSVSSTLKNDGDYLHAENFESNDVIVQALMRKPDGNFSHVEASIPGFGSSSNSTSTSRIDGNPIAERTQVVIDEDGVVKRQYQVDLAVQTNESKQGFFRGNVATLTKLAIGREITDETKGEQQVLDGACKLQESSQKLSNYKHLLEKTVRKPGIFRDSVTSYQYNPGEKILEAGLMKESNHSVLQCEAGQLGQVTMETVDPSTGLPVVMTDIPTRVDENSKIDHASGGYFNENSSVLTGQRIIDMKTPDKKQTTMDGVTIITNQAQKDTYDFSAENTGLTIGEALSGEGLDEPIRPTEQFNLKSREIEWSRTAVATDGHGLRNNGTLHNLSTQVTFGANKTGVGQVTESVLRLDNSMQSTSLFDGDSKLRNETVSSSTKVSGNIKSEMWQEMAGFSLKRSDEGVFAGSVDGSFEAASEALSEVKHNGKYNVDSNFKQTVKQSFTTENGSKNYGENAQGISHKKFENGSLTKLDEQSTYDFEMTTHSKQHSGNASNWHSHETSELHRGTGNRKILSDNSNQATIQENENSEYVKKELDVDVKSNVLATTVKQVRTQTEGTASRERLGVAGGEMEIIAANNAATMLTQISLTNHSNLLFDYSVTTVNQHDLATGQFYNGGTMPIFSLSNHSQAALMSVGSDVARAIFSPSSNISIGDVSKHALTSFSHSALNTIVSKELSVAFNDPKVGGFLGTTAVNAGFALIHGGAEAAAKATFEGMASQILKEVTSLPLSVSQSTTGARRGLINSDFEVVSKRTNLEMSIIKGISTGVHFERKEWAETSWDGTRSRTVAYGLGGHAGGGGVVDVSAGLYHGTTQFQRDYIIGNSAFTEYGERQFTGQLGVGLTIGDYGAHFNILPAFHSVKCTFTMESAVNGQPLESRVTPRDLRRSALPVPGSIANAQGFSGHDAVMQSRLANNGASEHIMNRGHEQVEEDHVFGIFGDATGRTYAYGMRTDIDSSVGATQLVGDEIVTSGQRTTNTAQFKDLMSKKTNERFLFIKFNENTKYYEPGQYRETSNQQTTVKNVKVSSKADGSAYDERKQDLERPSQGIARDVIIERDMHKVDTDLTTNFPGKNNLTPTSYVQEMLGIKSKTTTTEAVTRELEAVSGDGTASIRRAATEYKITQQAFAYEDKVSTTDEKGMTLNYEPGENRDSEKLIGVQEHAVSEVRNADGSNLVEGAKLGIHTIAGFEGEAVGNVGVEQTIASTNLDGKRQFLSAEKSTTAFGTLSISKQIATEKADVIYGGVVAKKIVTEGVDRIAYSTLLQAQSGNSAEQNFKLGEKDLKVGGEGSSASLFRTVRHTGENKALIERTVANDQSKDSVYVVDETWRTDATLDAENKVSSTGNTNHFQTHFGVNARETARTSDGTSTGFGSYKEVVTTVTEMRDFAEQANVKSGEGASAKLDVPTRIMSEAAPDRTVVTTAETGGIGYFSLSEAVKIKSEMTDNRTGAVTLDERPVQSDLSLGSKRAIGSAAGSVATVGLKYFRASVVEGKPVLAKEVAKDTACAALTATNSFFTGGAIRAAQASGKALKHGAIAAAVSAVTLTTRLVIRLAYKDSMAGVAGAETTTEDVIVDVTGDAGSNIASIVGAVAKTTSKVAVVATVVAYGASGAVSVYQWARGKISANMLLEDCTMISVGAGAMVGTGAAVGAGLTHLAAGTGFVAAAAASPILAVVAPAVIGAIAGFLLVWGASKLWQLCSGSREERIEKHHRAKKEEEFQVLCRSLGIEVAYKICPKKVRAAYLKQIRGIHPDKNGGQNHDETARVNANYARLLKLGDELGKLAMTEKTADGQTKLTWFRVMAKHLEAARDWLLNRQGRSNGALTNSTASTGELLSIASPDFIEAFEPDSEEFKLFQQETMQRC